MGSCGLERAARAGPAQIPVQARSNPVGCPDWVRTGQAGLARSNPARAPAGLAIWAIEDRGHRSMFKVKWCEAVNVNKS